MANEAYTMQVGGSHYIGMGMQPFQFAMRNGWDNGAFSILKYVSRHRSKKGVEDLQKGRHFVMMRLEERHSWLRSRRVISMGEYIRLNDINDRDAFALMNLESWVDNRITESVLLMSIDALIKEYDLGVAFT